MFIHRYHLPYYQQVAVFFWPILFFELWRVDRWQDETGRRAFVTPDKYGRAWVPYFEGMSQKPHVNGIETTAYKPADIDALCPGWLASAREVSSFFGACAQILKLGACAQTLTLGACPRAQPSGASLPGLPQPITNPLIGEAGSRILKPPDPSGRASVLAFASVANQI